MSDSEDSEAFPGRKNRHQFHPRRRTRRRSRSRSRSVSPHRRRSRSRSVSPRRYRPGHSPSPDPSGHSSRESSRRSSRSSRSSRSPRARERPDRDSTQVTESAAASPTKANALSSSSASSSSLDAKSLSSTITSAAVPTSKSSPKKSKKKKKNKKKDQRTMLLDPPTLASRCACGASPIVVCYECGNGGEGIPYCMICNVNEPTHRNDNTINGWGTANHFRTPFKYVEGDCLEQDENRTWEYKSVTKDIRQGHSAKGIIKAKAGVLINAFLNSGQGGVLAFGVQDVKMNKEQLIKHPIEHFPLRREDREDIRFIIERQVASMWPPVSTDEYRIAFVNVACQDGKDCKKIEGTHECFVLQVHVRKPPFPIYSMTMPVCFVELCDAWIRLDTSRGRMKPQQIRHRLGERAVPGPISAGFADTVKQLLRDQVHTGRLWLLDKVIECVKNVPGPRGVFIEGDVGFGKSSFVAELIYHSESWALWHMRNEASVKRRFKVWQEDFEGYPWETDEGKARRAEELKKEKERRAEEEKRAKNGGGKKKKQKVKRKKRSNKAPSDSSSNSNSNSISNSDSKRPERKASNSSKNDRGYQESAREPSLEIKPDRKMEEKRKKAEEERRNRQKYSNMKNEFHVIAHHFCSASDSQTLDPAQFVRSMAALIVTSSLKVSRRVMVGEQVEDALSESRCIKDPTGAFIKGILEPLRKLTDSGLAPSKPCVILVDALDESLHPLSVANKDTSQCASIVELLSKVVKYFPDWLTLICTSRRHPKVLQMTSHFARLEVNADDANNRRDIMNFVRARLDQICEQCPEDHPYNDQEKEETVQVICEKARGNFLHAQLTMNALRDKRLSLTTLQELVPGLGSLYYDFFSRKKRELDEPSFLIMKYVLSMLTASFKPVTIRMLQCAVGKQEAKSALQHLQMFLKSSQGSQSILPELPTASGISCVSSIVLATAGKASNYMGLSTLHSAQNQTSALEQLEKHGEPSYTLFHLSLSEWLTREADASSTSHGISSQRVETFCDKSIGHTLLASVGLVQIARFCHTSSRTADDPNRALHTRKALTMLSDWLRPLNFRHSLQLPFVTSLLSSVCQEVKANPDHLQVDHHTSSWLPIDLDAGKLPEYIVSTAKHLYLSERGSIAYLARLLRQFCNSHTVYCPTVGIANARRRQTKSKRSKTRGHDSCASRSKASRSQTGADTGDKTGQRSIESKAFKITSDPGDGLTAPSNSEEAIEDVVDQIIQQSYWPVLDSMDTRGRTAVFFVCAEQVEEPHVLELLLAAKATPNIPNKPYGQTPLNIAARRGFIRLCRLILECVEHNVFSLQLTVNLASSKLNTPLHTACRRARLDVAELLMLHSTIDTAERSGRTALSLACSHGSDEDLIDPSREIVRSLLFMKASLLYTDRKGRTPLWWACSKSHAAWSIVETLLTHAPSEDVAAAINLPDKTYKCAPLHIAAIKGHAKTVSILLQFGARTDCLNKDGEFPLFLACIYSHPEVVQVLLDHTRERHSWISSPETVHVSDPASSSSSSSSSSSNTDPSCDVSNRMAKKMKQFAQSASDVRATLLRKFKANTHACVEIRLTALLKPCINSSLQVRGCDKANPFFVAAFLSHDTPIHKRAELFLQKWSTARVTESKSTKIAESHDETKACHKTAKKQKPKLMPIDLDNKSYLPWQSPPQLHPSIPLPQRIPNESGDVQFVDVLDILTSKIALNQGTSSSWQFIGSSEMVFCEQCSVESVIVENMKSLNSKLQSTSIKQPKGRIRMKFRHGLSFGYNEAAKDSMKVAFAIFQLQKCNDNDFLSAVPCGSQIRIVGQATCPLHDILEIAHFPEDETFIFPLEKRANRSNSKATVQTPEGDLHCSRLPPKDECKRQLSEDDIMEHSFLPKLSLPMADLLNKKKSVPRQEIDTIGQMIVSACHINPQLNACVNVKSRWKAVKRSSKSTRMTPIFGAVACVDNKFLDKQEQVVESLLLAKADPNLAETAYGRTPLMDCAQENQIEMCSLLLTYGADPNMSERQCGEEPLLDACYEGHLHIVKLLVAAKSDLTLVDTGGANCLHYVVGRGWPDICEFLLQQPDVPIHRATYNLTPLQFAIQLRDYWYPQPKLDECPERPQTDILGSESDVNIGTNDSPTTSAPSYPSLISDNEASTSPTNIPGSSTDFEVSQANHHREHRFTQPQPPSLRIPPLSSLAPPNSSTGKHSLAPLDNNRSSSVLSAYGDLPGDFLFGNVREQLLERTVSDIVDDVNERRSSLTCLMKDLHLAKRAAPSLSSFHKIINMLEAKQNQSANELKTAASHQAQVKSLMSNWHALAWGSGDFERISNNDSPSSLSGYSGRKAQSCWYDGLPRVADGNLHSASLRAPPAITASLASSKYAPWIEPGPSDISIGNSSRTFSAPQINRSFRTPSNQSLNFPRPNSLEGCILTNFVATTSTETSCTSDTQ